LLLLVYKLIELFASFRIFVNCGYWIKDSLIDLNNTERPAYSPGVGYIHIVRRTETNIGELIALCPQGMLRDKFVNFVLCGSLF
jgi:hypothetical protein